MVSEKKVLQSYFMKKDYCNGDILFEELLAEAIINVLGKSLMEVDSYLQANLKRRWNELKKLIDNDLSKGISPYFEVYDESSKIIRHKECHYLLKSRPKILEQIDLINDREYEALACIVSKCLGAEKIYLTPPGNEGGIDFIATIKFSSNAHYFFGINGPIRIVGQCKKYKSPAQVKEVKEFLTTMGQIQHRSPVTENQIPTWFRAAKGPIIGWIISHEGIQSGGINLAKDFGIILSDTRDVAEIIASSKKHYPLDNPKDRARGLKKDIDEILTQNLYSSR